MEAAESSVEQLATLSVTAERRKLRRRELLKRERRVVCARHAAPGDGELGLSFESSCRHCRNGE